MIKRAVMGRAAPLSICLGSLESLFSSGDSVSNLQFVLNKLPTFHAPERVRPSQL
jgi:hypothetical protein